MGGTFFNGGGGGGLFTRGKKKEFDAEKGTYNAKGRQQGGKTYSQEKGKGEFCPSMDREKSFTQKESTAWRKKKVKRKGPLLPAGTKSLLGR